MYSEAAFIIPEKVLDSDLYEIVDMITSATDLNIHGTEHHGKRVAYISKRLFEYHFSQPAPLKLILAALLHDIGTQNFDTRHELTKLFPGETDLEKHSIDGKSLLEMVGIFKDTSFIVRNHHKAFIRLEGKIDEKTALYSNIINLADRIYISIDENKNILTQVGSILEKIKAFSNGFFNEGILNTLFNLSKNDSFWLDIINNDLVDKTIKQAISTPIVLSYKEISSIGDLCARLIDRKSHYTAKHSVNVAEISYRTSKLFNFDYEKCFFMRLAGNLHDLGKLSVPEEILHKPAQLDKNEMSIIRQHTYYTFHTMGKVGIFNDIKKWAAYHHENLDGTGYPFKVKGDEIPLEARIITIADKLVALTEDRPYRPKKKKQEVLNIMATMAQTNCIDRPVLDIVIQKYDIIMDGL